MVRIIYELQVFPYLGGQKNRLYISLRKQTIANK